MLLPYQRWTLQNIRTSSATGLHLCPLWCQYGKVLVEQAQLDRTDTIKGYYSLHDVTMDDHEPITISFDDTDITHVKYFKPQPSPPPKTNKDKMNLQTAAANEEGFYGVNESNPG